MATVEVDAWVLWLSGNVVRCETKQAALDLADVIGWESYGPDQTFIFPATYLEED